MSEMPSAPTTTRLPDWLRRSAENVPDRPALITVDDEWTFAELDRRATHAAQTLAAHGIREGTRVALLAGNNIAYAAAVHAVRRLGAILVPLNARLAASELAWQLEDVRAGLLLHDAPDQLSHITASLPDLPRLSLDDLLDSAPSTSDTPDAPLRDEIDLGATQAIVYTSGTTGRPKGAIITHGMQWWSATASALNLGLRDDDRWLACLPFFHVGGLSLLLKSVIYAMPLVVFDRFDARAVNAAISRDRVTMISVVAVMLRRMVDALDESDPSAAPARYPDHLRCVLLGGGPAPLPLLEDCARRGLLVSQTYGLTESCSQAATLAPADALRKLGSAGKPLLPVQLRIVAEDYTPAPAGAVGEIELRGPTITPGYDARPDATAAALRDGWLRTGDVGYLDADGYLYVLDRRADLIVSGGENVYPAEIEAVLTAHPAVLEAGVRAVPDARWGHVPLAFVHLREGATASEADLLTFLESRLAKYKVPRAIRPTGPLPRNAAGKLLRRRLPDA
jgi:O-succinylbenzoic acid--CoA ligase